MTAILRGWMANVEGIYIYISVQYCLTFPSKCGDCTILASLSDSLLIVDLHALQDDLLDLAYSALYGKSSSCSAIPGKNGLERRTLRKRI